MTTSSTTTTTTNADEWTQYYRRMHKTHAILHVNVAKALAAGLKFYRSKNDVILCAGDVRGRIPPSLIEKYTKIVINSEDGSVSEQEIVDVEQQVHDVLKKVVIDQDEVISRRLCALLRHSANKRHGFILDSQGFAKLSHILALHDFQGARFCCCCFLP